MLAMLVRQGLAEMSTTAKEPPIDSNACRSSRAGLHHLYTVPQQWKLFLFDPNHHLLKSSLNYATCKTCSEGIIFPCRCPSLIDRLMARQNLFSQGI